MIQHLEFASINWLLKHNTIEWNSRFAKKIEKRDQQQQWSMVDGPPFDCMTEKTWPNGDWRIFVDFNLCNGLSFGRVVDFEVTIPQHFTSCVHIVRTTPVSDKMLMTEVILMFNLAYVFHLKFNLIPFHLQVQLHAIDSNNRYRYFAAKERRSTSHWQLVFIITYALRI